LNSSNLHSIPCLAHRPEPYSCQVSYSLVVVLDSIVVILAFILNPIAKRRRRLEQEQQDSPDTLVSDHNAFTISDNLRSEAVSDEEKNARVMPLPDLSVEIPEEQRRREHGESRDRLNGDIV